MTEQDRTPRPHGYRWALYALPVVLACTLGWGMHQDIALPYLVAIIAILALSAAVGLMVLRRGSADRRSGGPPADPRGDTPGT